MRKILIIIFLLFTVFVFVCCESKKEAMMRREAEQQKFDKKYKEDRQREIIYMRIGRPDRYKIFQHQQFAKNIFLLDTMDGRVWILIEDKETKELIWQELNVENQDILSIKEFFKNDK